MDDDEPRSGELTTANYGWVKPTVADSDDAWGGMLNADLDGIDTTVKSVSTVANAAYPASNPSGYQTAANVTTSLAPYALTASVPVASTAAPIMDSVAAAGTGTTWARADHVHPLAFQVIGDNRIINGDMWIDQRNGGASGTASGYTVDRWQYAGAQVNKGTWGRVTSGPPAFPYALSFGSSSAYASVAGDYFEFIQSIEADMVSDFAWGTASAQPVTLSFTAISSLTGTFSGAIANFAGTRSYPFIYSIPTASTWTRITITIPGDTAGTWVMNGNAAAMQLRFDLGSGSTYRGSAGAWSSSNYIGVTGAVSLVAVNGGTLNITGVKLEIGSVATPYNRQSLAKSKADCQRYYQSGAFKHDAYGAAGAAVGSYQAFPVQMRATPSPVTPTFTTQTNGSGGGALAQGAFGVEIYTVATVTGGVALLGTFTASAEL